MHVALGRQIPKQGHNSKTRSNP